MIYTLHGNFFIRKDVLFRKLSCLYHKHQLFGTKHVVQKRKHMLKILKPKQTPYVPKDENYSPLPLSLLGSGPIRRMIYSKSQDALDMSQNINWDKYRSNIKGVRWHPNGSWRVQFDRRNYENNFFVRCDCYFRVSIYGFSKAKDLAIAYRKRLQAEWDELESTWYNQPTYKSNTSTSE